MNEEAFRTIVERVWSDMPETVVAKIKNVALLVADEPDAETRQHESLQEGETLLGLYQGIPQSERGTQYGVGMTLPDTITIYRLPTLEDAAEIAKEQQLTLEEAVAVSVRETIWHEVGHYFGLGEGEVQLREEEGSNRFH